MTGEAIMVGEGTMAGEGIVAGEAMLPALAAQPGSVELTVASAAELSCYTANLAPFLSRQLPGVETAMAEAIRLALRLDPAEGELAFSHHRRIDLDPVGRRLSYRGASHWDDARAALDSAVAAQGQLLVVGNTYYLPWSPQHGRHATSHWLLLSGQRAGRWLIEDHFQALTPHGEQYPWQQEVDGDTLRMLLTPLGRVEPVVANRDRYALGAELALPPYTGYRWLEWAEPVPAGAEPGQWLTGLRAGLRHLAELVIADAAVLERYADDLWTLARHQRHRLAVQAAAAVAAGGVALGGDAQVAMLEVADAWGELPRTVRFVLASAERGRPRPAMLRTAFERILAADARLEAMEAGTGEPDPGR